MGPHGLAWGRMGSHGGGFWTLAARRRARRRNPAPTAAPKQMFKHVVSVPNAQKTALAWNFQAFGNSHLWVALITFLYLDFLDATGTM